MKALLSLLLLLLANPVEAKQCSSLLDVDVRMLNDSKQVNLCEQYQGKVILVVNTASKCAYTDQYESLEKLYRDYRDKGLVVLGFPSNDFGAQEPGTEKQIQSFCRLTYGVDFPMFAKTRVTERNADPLYRALAAESGRYPRWNFHKYLIGRDGELVRDYMSSQEPLGKKLVADIEQQLAQTGDSIPVSSEPLLK